tara:strand:- start:566 stop:967 length:402 start_codon:yes stop_codon:yes gene_type:complete
MANEASIIELLGDDGEAINFSVFNNEAIPKGTLCMLSGAGTRQATLSVDDPNLVFGGIAATEKESGDGQTTLGLFTKGTFYLTASGVINRGQMVSLSGVNTVAMAELSGSSIVGKALTAGTDGTKVEVAVGVY